MVWCGRQEKGTDCVDVIASDDANVKGCSRCRQWDMRKVPDPGLKDAQKAIHFRPRAWEGLPRQGPGGFGTERARF